MNIKRISFQLLKVVVSAGLIIFLLSRKSPGELAPYLKDLDPALLLTAVGIFFSSSLLGALQWFILLRAADVILPFGKTFRLYFTGLFFNNFLPANVGGDALKIFDVVRTGNDPHKVFAVTLLDRVFGITGLCLLALIASFFLYARDSAAYNWLYILIFLSCIVPVFLLALNRRISRSFRSVLGKIGLWGIGSRIDQVLLHLGNLRNLRSMSVRLILLTLLIQSLRIATHIFVGRSLGIDTGWWANIHFFVFVPLLGLVMTLPVSINGLGIREGAGVVLFMQIGIGEELAVLMEFITYVVQLAVSLLGGIFFIMRKHETSG
ncbi:MAG: flippase-like domain-containing protein [Candidatus Krumholzibacteriota bacterium]|nr:flippase-like domain-containing protein [Candidatus Krumholzibacteriota bacterium]